jgi:predicted hydrocarbon binding protein
MQSDQHIKWTNQLLNELSEKDKDLGIEVLKTCGRNCCKDSDLYKNAVIVRNQFPDSTDFDFLFQTFKKQFYNTDDFQKNGNEITLILQECTCDMVKEGVTNEFLCHCTKGYSHQIFETLFGTKVEVILVKSILNGDSICEQKINILPDKI